MNGLMRIVTGGLMISVLLLATGCAVYPAHRHDDHGYGPPPHAPAHGYRAKYDNHDLIYDSHLGVYVVLGLPDYYFYDGHYYRHDRDGWYSSKRTDRDWSRYKEKKLPPGLAKKYHDDGHDRDKDRDRDRDKGRR